jgi:hypothetical protein
MYMITPVVLIAAVWFWYFLFTLVSKPCINRCCPIGASSSVGSLKGCAAKARFWTSTLKQRAVRITCLILALA